MIDSLNEDIVQMLDSIDQFNDAIGNPAAKYRSYYDELKKLKIMYFKRLRGRLNFKVFADLLEFFDRSFIDMVAKLLPARVDFMGDEFVVESHMLERSKVIFGRRKGQELDQDPPEGKIEMFSRFDDDKVIS